MRSDRREQTGTSNSLLAPVTGLPDERAYALLVERKLAHARRSLNPLSLISIALDEYEYMTESELRVATLVTARVVNSTLRYSDTLCDLGGVFIAILDDTPDSGAIWAANRVRATLSRERQSINVTLSMGVATYPTHALEGNQLHAEVVSALEVARSLGPERIEVAG